MTKSHNLLKGIWSENPVLISMLGLCPTLAITRTVENALGMGLAVMFVLVMSNIIVSLIKNIVPSEIRIPVYIVIIATLVTLVEMLMAAFLPGIHKSLGIFLPLIVVNCIILGRAEAFASKNNVKNSVLDAIGMALGLTLVLFVMSFIREFFASGIITVWGDFQIKFIEIIPFRWFTDVYTLFFTNSAAAFLVLGFILAFAQFITRKKTEVKQS